MGYSDNRAARPLRKRRRRLKKHYRILLAAVVCLACAALLIGLIRALRPQKTEEPEARGAAAETVAREEAEEAPEAAYALHTVPETRRLGEELKSEFALLADAETGVILAEKNAGARLYPASMTKVLTLLVAAEHMPDTGGTFIMTREIADYCFTKKCSVVGYEVGEEIPVRELAYGCILCSGADASLALAQLSAGSQEVFVGWMNDKLEELGLSETAHFTNCVGVFDEDHYCTARDMARMMQAALENEACRDVLSTPVFLSEPTEQHPDGQALSNWFLRRMEGQDTGGVTTLCGKTGYVPESGNCAVSYGEDEAGHGYLCVTGKADSTWLAISDHALLYREFVTSG